MADIRRILCPIDFSDISRHALEHAVVIARWYDAPITVLHVGRSMIVLGTFVPVPPSAVDVSRGESPSQWQEQQVRDWLSSAVEGMQVDVMVEEGNPARRILEEAHALAADLIVMGTHGEGGFDRLVLGSVAEKVLRKATCPVLTVAPRSGNSKLPFEHVLCAVDFSDSSVAGLQFALSLAQEANARVTVLHVLDWPLGEESARRVIGMSEFHRQWEAETREHLERLIPAEVRNWCEPQSKLAFGKVHEQILNTAAAEHADLIVMGVRGRTPVDLMIFGSTTNQVVRRATCPVLTLRR